MKGVGISEEASRCCRHNNYMEGVRISEGGSLCCRHNNCMERVHLSEGVGVEDIIIIWKQSVY